MTSRHTWLHLLQSSENKWQVWQSGYIDTPREADMVKWCVTTFGEFSNEWKAMQIGFHRSFFFNREEDAVLFMLRWS